MRKFSTGCEEQNEDEMFKNKTLRFTNNNFVATNNNDKNKGTMQY